MSKKPENRVRSPKSALPPASEPAHPHAGTPAGFRVMARPTGPVRKVTYYLQAETLKRLALYAIDLNVKMNPLVERAVAEMLDREGR